MVSKALSASTFLSSALLAARALRFSSRIFSYSSRVISCNRQHYLHVNHTMPCPGQ
ncbi:hypothetical protein Mapa_018544 [Marchantia paleacea]|nr:hypothetical protein Mapa_018544 [Marchantia paleacea]